jgi:molecular chaperone GrpE
MIDDAAMNQQRKRPESGARQPQDEPVDTRAGEDLRQDHDEAPIEVSDEAADLIRRLQDERDAATAARQRALADFVNYQRRASENEQRAAREAAARVLRSLIPVLDHFDLALEQPREAMTVDQLLGGVRIVRDELMKAMEHHGVERIEPAPGDEFEPMHHEAMLRRPAPDIPPDSIIAVLQPGYRLGPVVLRPAKVVIAEGPQGGDAAAGT